MTIASKIFYFQRQQQQQQRAGRSRSLEQSPEPRSRHGQRLRRAPQGLDSLPGRQRIATGYGAGRSSFVEATTAGLFGSRLRKDGAEDRLPDDVQKARERLLCRLRSVDLGGTSQRTEVSETIWAGIEPVAESSTVLSNDVAVDNITKVGYFCEPERKASLPSFQALSKLEKEVFKGTEEAGASVDCSICLERFQDGDGLIQLRCNHRFHSGCLERWVQTRGECPYCRASVFLTTE